MHMGINQAGKSQKIVAFDNLRGICRWNIGVDQSKLFVFDADISQVYRLLVGSDQADVLDNQIELHDDFSIFIALIYRMIN